MVNTVVLLTDSNDFEVVACLDIQAGTQLAWWYGPGYARGSEYRVPGGMEAYEQDTCGKPGELLQGSGSGCRPNASAAAQGPRTIALLPGAPSGRGSRQRRGPASNGGLQQGLRADGAVDHPASGGPVL